MKKIMDSVWTWSVFSEEKGYNFNGFLIQEGGDRILIDPVTADETQMAFLEKMLPVKSIYLTNKDHERFSYALRRRWQLPISIHYKDAGLLKEKPDGTFKEGDLLDCGIEVVHLPDQKSPGECAFYQREKGFLILGDALIGVPAGRLKMLPSEKYKDAGRAKSGLQRLRPLSFDILLLGDGEAVLSKPHDLLEQLFLEQAIESMKGNKAEN